MIFLKFKKRMKLFIYLVLIGMSVSAQNIPDSLKNFGIYEYEGKLSLREIFAPNANLTGGIKGIIGTDDFDDADDFFDPMINVIIADKRTNTIIYDIYIDSTSTSTHQCKYWEYDAPELGESAIFFPFTWNSNNIKLSAFAIDRFYADSVNHPYSFIQDTIDVIVRIVVNNANIEAFDAKIPGLISLNDKPIMSSNSNISPAGFWDFITPEWSHQRDCAAEKYKNKCPCAAWNKMKNSVDYKYMVAAHRGIWGGVLGSGPPENSVSAIKAVKQQNWDIVEMDVMLSKDGQLVVSHDYVFERLSDFSESGKFMFSRNFYDILSWFTNLFRSQTDPRHAHLKKRNGTVSNTYYLLFKEALDLIHRDGLVALIDIKELIKKTEKTGACVVNCEYDPETISGRQKMKESWLKIMQKCYHIASEAGLLDYIAFKTPYTFEEIIGPGGLSYTQARFVRFMPMVQPPNARRGWNNRRALSLISSWLEMKDMHNNIVAMEINFNSLTDPYLDPVTYSNTTYANLPHLVRAYGFRPGIFSEEPVGSKGVSERWARWIMPDPNGNIRADHLKLMTVPYFYGAVITTDRPDIWKQINDNLGHIPPTPNTSSAVLQSDITDINEITLDNMANITASYESGFIIINGLKANDIGSNVMLYDLQGRLIHTNKINAEPQMFISQSIGKGVYILRISGSRSVSVKLITN